MKKFLVIPICALVLIGAFAVSVYAAEVGNKPDSKLAADVSNKVSDVNNQTAVSIDYDEVSNNPDSKLSADVIDVTGEQINESVDYDIAINVDYRKRIAENCKYYGTAITDEQLQKIEELYRSLNRVPNSWERLPYGVGIITGEIDPDAPKLDLAAARKIIAEHNDFDEIMSEFDKVQKYPDFVGGSGHPVVQYWLNDSRNEEITVFHLENGIWYAALNPDGTAAYTEKLF